MLNVQWIYIITNKSGSIIIRIEVLKIEYAFGSYIYFYIPALRAACTT